MSRLFRLEKNLIERMQVHQVAKPRGVACKCVMSVKLKPLHANWLFCDAKIWGSGVNIVNCDWTKTSSQHSDLLFCRFSRPSAARDLRLPLRATWCLEINALKHLVQPEKAFCAFCLSFNGKEKRPLSCCKPSAEKNLCVNLFSIC